MLFALWQTTRGSYGSQPAHFFKMARVKLLIVDDHPLFRDGLAALLRQAGTDFHVTQASSAEEALNLADEQIFDAVFMDLMMPGMCGEPAIREFARRHPDLPVIVLSSSENPGDVRRVINAGAWENWRPDSGAFDKRLVGASLAGWPAERWLDVRGLEALGPVLARRLDLCRDKGFDGVLLRNLDAYRHRSGFPLSAKDQLAYNRMLAQAARQQELESAARIRVLTGLLEPAIIVVMGAVVLLVVLAVLLPIIELNQLVRP